MQINEYLESEDLEGVDSVEWGDVEVNEYNENNEKSSENESVGRS